MMRSKSLVCALLLLFAPILLATAYAQTDDAGGPATVQSPGVLSEGIRQGETSGLGDLGGAPSAGGLDVESATAFFERANALYAEGRYSEAAAIYAQLAASEYGNADVYYNLGNASYKAGAPGRAVLAYERALLSDPTHEDARYNLAYVRERLVDRQQPIESGPVMSALARAFDRAGKSGTAVLASALYALLAAALIFGIVRGAFAPWLRKTVTVVAAALVVSLALAGAAAHRAASVRGAIVVAQQVGVRTGPGEEFVLEFRIHEGTKVRIREERDDWLRVSVAGADLEGWLRRGEVEEIHRTGAR